MADRADAGGGNSGGDNRGNGGGDNGGDGAGARAGGGDGKGGGDPDGSGGGDGGAGGDGGGSGKTYSESQFNSVVAERKKFKERAQKAEDRLANLETKVNELGADEDSIKAFKEFKTNAAKAEEDKLRQAGEFDKIKEGLLTKHSEELSAEKELTQTYRNLLLDQIRDNKVEALVAGKVFSVRQVLNNVRPLIKVDEPEPGKFSFSFTDEETGETVHDDKMEPVSDLKTFLDLYLAKPHNLNLLKASIKEGGATIDNGSGQPGGQDVTSIYKSGDVGNAIKNRNALHKVAVSVGNK